MTPEQFYNKALTEAIKMANAKTSQFKPNWKPLRKNGRPKTRADVTTFTASMEQADYTLLAQSVDPHTFVAAEVHDELIGNAEEWLQTALDDLVKGSHGRS